MLVSISDSRCARNVSLASESRVLLVGCDVSSSATGGGARLKQQAPPALTEGREARGIDKEAA